MDSPLQITQTNPSHAHSESSLKVSLALSHKTSQNTDIVNMKIYCFTKKMKIGAGISKHAIHIKEYFSLGCDRN